MSNLKMKVSKKGSPDSKYFCRQDEFEKDISRKVQQRAIDRERIKNSLVQLIEDNPAQMERNYRIMIESLIEIKREKGF